MASSAERRRSRPRRLAVLGEELPECGVHGLRVAKHPREIRLEEDEVGSLVIAAG
jgi:hypothetical protein